MHAAEIGFSIYLTSSTINEASQLARPAHESDREALGDGDCWKGK
jgi:hypothetical protein